MSDTDIIAIPNNPPLHGMAEAVENIVFARPEGMELSMTLLRPWQQHETDRQPVPLIVFVQGSGWTFPRIGFQLPQMARYAQGGRAVAMITHRNATQGHPFPAFLQDVKTAIRHLRANAAEYGIDPGRVCVFGTSSGGNAALLAGLTGDDPRYRTEEYDDQSDSVQAVIACFGPTDIEALFHNDAENIRAHPVYSGLLGSQDAGDVMRAMSPILQIEEGRQYPPFLLIHGDQDELVPYEQSLDMFRALRNAGHAADLIRVIGAPHEGNFWSDRLHGLIAEFLDDKL
jgi:acetyl esterase/lipase